MSKKAINDELQNLSPLLREMRQKGDGFRVPEGYFEAVEESVFGRINAAGARRKPVLESKRGGLFGRIFHSKIIVRAAAAVLVLVLAATWLFKTKHRQSSTFPVVAAQDLTEEEIEAYVLENIHEFEAEQLAALPAVEHTAPHTEPLPAPKPQAKEPDLLDSLSEEELEILLKDMSDEELEGLLKT
jgi:hypothetical protein